MNQQVHDSIIRKQALAVSPLKTHPSGYKWKMKPKERVTALSMHKERAARSKSLTDLAESNQPRGGLEMCSRVLRPSSWVPEIAGLPISRPSWFQPASKNRKNSLSRCFSTSASRPRKEQEVWGRVKRERTEDLHSLCVKG